MHSLRPYAKLRPSTDTTGRSRRGTDPDTSVRRGARPAGTLHAPVRQTVSALEKRPLLSVIGVQDFHIKPILLRHPGVMSSAELASWAQIGKNAIPRLTAWFGIAEITGKTKHQRFSAVDVLRRILGATPGTPEDFDELMKPLQAAAWVAAVTGVSVSMLSEGARTGSLRLPTPIELYETQPGQAAPRCRRWVAAAIEAHLARAAIPYATRQMLGSEVIEPPARNVFEAICTDNSKLSPQRRW